MKTMVDLFLRGQTRISYRRLLCFLTATGLLLADKLVASDWLYVAVAFIAGEALPKMAEAYRSNDAGTLDPYYSDEDTGEYGKADTMDDETP